MLKIESTNNDSIIKFVSDTILTKGSFEYNNIDEAKNSKLVQQLFYLPFVKKIFISANFIAVERYKIVEWSEVKNDLNQLISNYLSANGSLFNIENATPQKIAVQVYTESTPNPNVNKFVSNKFLSKLIVDVNKEDDLKEVPIASSLFSKFPSINEIFISQNYISISKDESIDWFEITNEIRDFIRKYLQENKTIATENYMPKAIAGFKIDTDSNISSDLDEVSKEIISVLDEYIKPAVTADGGNIMFQSYNRTTKVVEVVLQGACSGCPSSTITLKNGIEATLKQVLPNKINEVVAING